MFFWGGFSPSIIFFRFLGFFFFFTKCCWLLDNLHINPTSFLFTAAKFFHPSPSHHESILWEVYHQKKLPLYPPTCLKTKFAAPKKSVKFITTAQSCFSSLAFSTETFQTEEFIMRRREAFLLFLFSLFPSANVVCSWLCQSWLDSLRQSLYVLGDQEWK